MDVVPELLARSRLTHGLVQLSASLAVVDAPLNREEFAAFRTLFPMPAKRDLRMRGWLMEACERPVDARRAGEILLPLFDSRPEMLEEILSRFVALAWADNTLHDLERLWLRACTESLHLPLEHLAQMIEGSEPDSTGLATHDNPYRVFGLLQDATLAEVKRAYHRQLRAFHPDALAGQGLPLEEQERYGRRITEINVAYDRVMRLRGER